ncbi:MAG: peptidoglycan-associated lipoprotein Pal, partial [Proteobacteria bacterium]|nr:peptidoglycan-associated lipoprotein Pal [Pseudomonadota bacterium]
MLTRKWLVGLFCLMATATLLGLGGCAKDEVGSSGLSREELARRRAAAEMAARRAAAMRRMELLRQKFYNDDVLFDFDRSVIRPDARVVLQAKAQYMKSNPAVRVVIEGHCDERGSRSYNMALGDRRAKAAKRYLIQLGIAAGRMKTVSFGKNRPACRQHNEACWQKNR